MNICIIAITMLCQCFLHTSLHFVILSLSTEPGKGKEERAVPQDSLHTEVKSESIRCLPVYLDVHQCVPVYLDVHQCIPVYLDIHQCVLMYLAVHQCVPMNLDVQCVPVYLDMLFVAWADQSAKCVYLNYCTLVIIIEICQLVA